MTYHPITPPPELVRDWAQKAQLLAGDDPEAFAELLCNKAAHWGADQELEACCEHLKRIWSPSDTIDSLRAARRPKPLSLKEQALDSFEFIGKCHAITGPDWANIRRALEHLQELENND